MSSYLQNRTQSVIIGSQLSESETLKIGVPQGSVLGPLLFCLYTTPLASIFDNSSITPHFYADDSQLYTSFSCTDSASSLTQLSSKLDSTYNWLTSNRLSVNPLKTDYLLIGTPRQRSKVLSSSISFRGQNLSPSSETRNLGVIFDSSLSFSKHVSDLCRSCFYHICQLRQARSSLDTKSATILANALVNSKLDYCNSLLYSLPATILNRLQRVQNSLARVVIPTTGYNTHIKPILHKLHWLPISERITFKIAALTFKTLFYKQPLYLAELLYPYKPSRALRSSNLNLLSVPNIKSSLGRRFFLCCTFCLELITSISSKLVLPQRFYLKRLKTHLFHP